ncbi:hypothetical protein H6G35_35655 [Aulosira sp. FACHB-113]|uniref:hypothetical protein n=1 Tax=Tolypothrix tenuis TaxID=457083 RepID=UPI001687D24B|nr:hypothetical protein [Aulosira sp. FACHB-113]
MNRKEQIYYLHQGMTKTGKPKYFFSMKNEGHVIEAMPKGYEIYENPNAQVFLRKVQPKIISDEERSTVEEGIKKFSNLESYQIDLKNSEVRIQESEYNQWGIQTRHSLFA